MSCPVFISYKRVNKQKVFAIKDNIEQRTGVKCWIDLDGIESHAQFVSVIINAIDACQIVLFMYSQAHSLIKDFENDYTIKELTYAAEEGKRIVFINIDRSPLAKWFRFQYGTKQHVDALDPTRLDKLAADIRNWLNLPAPKPADNAGKRTATQQPYASNTLGQRTAMQQPSAPSTPVQRTTTQQPTTPPSPEATATNNRYILTLTSAGDSKLQMVKMLKDLLEIGLVEAKNIVDSTPKTLPGTWEADVAVAIKDCLESAGATVGMKFVTKPQTLKRATPSSKFILFLASIGPAKQQVAKAVKEAIGLGLREAKDLVDSAPTQLPFIYEEEEVARIIAYLEGAGATVRVNLATKVTYEDTARYRLTLVSTGAAKLQVVKATKEALQTGLKEAKDLTDAAPVVLPNIYNLVQAKRIKDFIEGAGATMKMERV